MARLSRESLLILGVGLVVVAGLTLGGFFTREAGISTQSHSMSHNAANQMAGIIDPGDTVGEVGVPDLSAVTTEVAARRTGLQVAGDYGDVITYRPDVYIRNFSIIHRALVFVAYNASADAYDVPDLGLFAVRRFVVPETGTYDERTESYVHVPFTVSLDPSSAGRHDGLVTKGDNNVIADQDENGGWAHPDGDDPHGLTHSVELVQLAQIEGKVSRIADQEDATTIFYYAAGGAALLTLGAVVALPRLRRTTLSGSRCAQCGRRVRDEDEFCVACGLKR